MAEISSESQLFSGNIGNMIPESHLNKMVPLMEDHGVHGEPLLAHGLFVKARDCQISMFPIEIDMQIFARKILVKPVII